MQNKNVILILSLLILSGCATADKNLTIELQQCQNKISNLEQKINEKDEEISGLEQEMYKENSKNYWKETVPVESKVKVDSTITPSTIQIQKALKKAGYYASEIDGKIGIKTEEAIKKFQKDNGFKADGKVGKITWGKLKKYLN